MDKPKTPEVGPTIYKNLVYDKSGILIPLGQRYCA